MEQRSFNKFNLFVILVTFLFLFFIGMESVAFARAGGGRSSGSRGFSSGSGKTYQRTAPTRTPSSAQQPSTQAPPIQQPQQSFGRSLLYGIGGGLMGGMIGSMLFGGRGHAGSEGAGGGGFGFGDIIILLVIAGIIYFVYKKYRTRKAEEMQMSAAGAGYSTAYSYNEPLPEPAYESASRQEDMVSQGLRHIKEMDSSFDKNRFKELAEDNFFKIQTGWTKRDLSSVRSLLTPRMLNTFQTDINGYLNKKHINRLENIAMRQIEIVDAVQDQGEEYITVKFLASILDYTIDESNNNIISGSSSDPVKFLEYWTFTRKVGDGNWLLAGITQEADY